MKTQRRIKERIEVLKERLRDCIIDELWQGASTARDNIFQLEWVLR